MKNQLVEIVESSGLEQLKFTGIVKGWESRPVLKDWLEELRAWAWTTASIYGRVTSDDVRHHFKIEKGIGYENQIMGGVFRDKRFKRIGYRSSSFPGSHGRTISIWGVK